jgi:tripartite-type tricarboxylate transporter receptor subunit TctC
VYRFEQLVDLDSKSWLFSIQSIQLTNPMENLTMQRRTLLSLAAASISTPSVLLAQSDRPINIVLGYTAGGTTDYIARTVAAEMAKVLGRQVIVDNVPGVSGMLGAQKVANGPTDGSLIYLGGTDTVVIPMLNDKARIQWDRDFVPIGTSTYVSMVLAVGAKSPYQSLSDVVNAIRKGKKDFTYATPGVGTMQHLYGSVISQKAKIQMIHVPYKGGAQISNDLVGGHVESAVLTTTSAMNFIKDGSIRAISIADSVRSPLIPNVKTLGEEEGFPATAMPLWHAFFLKAGTPAPIVAAYEKALTSVVTNPEIQKKFRDAGATPWVQSAKEMPAYIRSQAALFKDVISSSKIVAE